MSYSQKATYAAQKLRADLSPPEVRLWVRLRGRRDGLYFRRQHPLAGYVLDFYCHAARLAVEVDGYAHGTADRPQRDAWRDQALREIGVETLRLRAGYVMDDPDAAARTVLVLARERGDLPPPPLRGSSPASGGGGMR